MELEQGTHKSCCLHQIHCSPENLAVPSEKPLVNRSNRIASVLLHIFRN